ncbi:nuclear transport factor 2 family protein [Pedobacter sp. L105]|uniref:nuclear transport factor 2 family protein n=1 Tax=Pedobacter sp. L105 TaxID=1641871 RepID=UPI00131E0C96|nr:nuclear transport factor 2 family protein [Pedobacter sp. L105]
MKTTKLLLFISVISLQQVRAQQAADHKKEIRNIIDSYSRSVIQKDSATFYDLFNSGTVTWCAALKDRSQAKELEKRGAAKVRSNYFSSTYKGFFRSLFRYVSTEDKFDNIRIVEDGTVATVTMDYSFWADHKMTNWGGKYLTLIKKDGKWKITSVIYSLELSEYFEQPALKDRQTVSF